VRLEPAGVDQPANFSSLPTLPEVTVGSCDPGTSIESTVQSANDNKLNDRIVLITEVKSAAFKSTDPFATQMSVLSNFVYH